MLKLPLCLPRSAPAMKRRGAQGQPSLKLPLRTPRGAHAIRCRSARLAYLFVAASCLTIPGNLHMLRTLTEPWLTRCTWYSLLFLRAFAEPRQRRSKEYYLSSRTQQRCLHPLCVSCVPRFRVQVLYPSFVSRFCIQVSPQIQLLYTGFVSRFRTHFLHADFVTLPSTGRPPHPAPRAPGHWGTK